MRVATGAVLAGLMLLPLAGCGGGGDGGGRPAGVLPSYDSTLLAYQEQSTTDCVLGPAGNGAGCSQIVRQTLDTLHELRDAIKARPDADRYPKTLAEIETVDQSGDAFGQLNCWGSSSSQCIFKAEQIIGNKVRTTLAAEDAPADRRRG
jgi:hypothetical protein